MNYVWLGLGLTALLLIGSLMCFVRASVTHTDNDGGYARTFYSISGLVLFLLTGLAGAMTSVLYFFVQLPH